MPVFTKKRPAAGRWLLALLLLAAVTLVIATACVGGPDGEEAETVAPESSSEPEADREAEEEASLTRDAEMYAKQKGVSVDEAVRRLRLQQDLSSSGLQSGLIENERDSFAGLWIQHEPEYRFVVLFTRDGEEKIQPYIEGEPWADVVEVRNGASATLAELEAAQADAECIVRDLGAIAQSGINQQENRVELEVRDRTRLEAALREAGARLPERVEVIEVTAMPEPKAGNASPEADSRYRPSSP